ncbi:hypothetical protein MAPG_10261 [Magnaporthiopsis poae ATCC 64411]|uniref:Peptidase S8/S53 domain-containing protein n=1 Tax=Magnaporthiopsis poae (strain ATCC 64411 / 73-15) TaxID=644358 RepID=A0A0C4EC47_MAGP6|nr:hypothetical protein MAPG_10261 [Magnaporthiopsis poae ATCC 64411]
MESKTPRDRRELFDAKDGLEEDETAEGWFDILTDINEKLDEQRIGRFKRVKIAILDTGIDMTNEIFNNPEAKQRIKQREDFLREDPSQTVAHDECGHGSHCAGLLRRVAPAADIYVARIAKDFDTGLDAEAVIKAIERACTPKTADTAGWDVDIITMSFGFQKQIEPVEAALRKALNRGKIIFAAASNSGARREIAFPAWVDGVLCVNSATGDGIPSTFNPLAQARKNLAILGENVRSAWISSQQPTPEPKHKETRSMSGTSMATPIAAAVVSLLLEVAINPGLPEARHIFEHYLPKIRKSEGVRTILEKASHERGGYMVINPKFLEGENRLEIAYWVRRMLRDKYGAPAPKSERALTIPPCPQPTVSRPLSVPYLRQEIWSPLIPPTAADVPKLGLFYALTNSQDHILPDASSYWRYLTLPAYEIYETIYEECKDPDSGWVDYTRFAAQFNDTVTEPSTIESTWSRLLRNPGDITSSSHPKGLAMAALYMLHLERYRRHLRPLDDEKQIGVSRSRRSQLKGFGTWVGCRCSAKCAVLWNFVNDVGLHRGGKPKSCVLAKLIDRGKVGFFSSGRKEEAVLEDTQKDWLDSVTVTGAVSSSFHAPEGAGEVDLERIRLEESNVL